jgi:hypothetical protein
MGEQRAGAERVGTVAAAAQRRMASTAFLVREEVRQRRTGKKVARSHCRPAPPPLLSPLSKAEARLYAPAIITETRRSDSNIAHPGRQPMNASASSGVS